MLNKEFIKSKISLIQRDLSRLKEMKDLSINQVAENYVNYGFLKNVLVEIIGRALDINQHIIKENNSSTEISPQTYKETFLHLGNLKILPKKFSSEVSKSAGFRNAIVHEYNNLDSGIVYNTVNDAIKQYSQYCKYILKFLNK